MERPISEAKTLVIETYKWKWLINYYIHLIGSDQWYKNIADRVYDRSLNVYNKKSICDSVLYKWLIAPKMYYLDSLNMGLSLDFKCFFL